MRKIENEIIDIMDSGKGGWHVLSKRDMVWNSVCNSFYYLWKNNIYAKLNDYNKSVVERFSLCGYDTPTTRSRLNALLINGKIQRRKGKVYFIHNNGKTFEVDINKTYCVDYRG